MDQACLEENDKQHHYNVLEKMMDMSWGELKENRKQNGDKNRTSP